MPTPDNFDRSDLRHVPGRDLLALLLLGEQREDPICVREWMLILRVVDCRRRYERWGKPLASSPLRSVADVLLEPEQFSCFNPGSEFMPLAGGLLRELVTGRAAALYEQARAVVEAGAVCGLSRLPMVNHYVAASLYDAETGSGHWWRRMREIERSGRHVFLRGR